jgi:hypothetical protein
MKAKLDSLQQAQWVLDIRPVDAFVVSRYRQAWRTGAAFPPIIADKATREIISGNHRWQSAMDEFGPDFVHTTQKPVAVMEKIVAVAPAGGLVLDPFMGSGTTGVACIRTGRRFVGIEKDPVYFEVAKKRIAAELSQGVLDFGGGAAAPTHNAEAHASATKEPIA